MLEDRGIIANAAVNAAPPSFYACICSTHPAYLFLFFNNCLLLFFLPTLLSLYSHLLYISLSYLCSQVCAVI